MSDDPLILRPQSEHSPLPWRHTRDQRFDDNIVSDATGNDLFALYTNDGLDDPTWFPAQANAKFIVRACNAHDDLLAACQKVVAHYGDPAEGALFGLRAAIAKATGEPHVSDPLLVRPRGEMRNYLKEGREYVSGERRALPDVALVVGLMHEIDLLAAAVDTGQRLLSELIVGTARKQGGS